jgi:hypothetical protein
METPTTFGHVTGLMIFERPSPGYDPCAAVYAKYASLVGQLEPLRRRVVEVPFGLDHPCWVSDPNFDLDYHIRELQLARPGLADQLAEQVCRIVGRPMGRCGRSTSSTVCRTGAGRCSPSTTTPPSTALPDS